MAGLPWLDLTVTTDHNVVDGAAASRFAGDLRQIMQGASVLTSAAGPVPRADGRATADLAFNDEHDLVDFVSDDRSRVSADGKSFLRQRWSTPVHDYQMIGRRRIPNFAEAQWHAPEPEGEFTYVELHLDHVEYNAGGAPQASRSPRDTSEDLRQSRPRSLQGS